MFTISHQVANHLIFMHNPIQILHSVKRVKSSQIHIHIFLVSRRCPVTPVSPATTNLPYNQAGRRILPPRPTPQLPKLAITGQVVHQPSPSSRADTQHRQPPSSIAIHTSHKPIPSSHPPQYHKMASDAKPEPQPAEEKKPEQKTTALGEDDEFEDFPVDGTYPLPPTPLFRTKQTWCIAKKKGKLTKTIRLARGPDRGRPGKRRDEAPVGGKLGR